MANVKATDLIDFARLSKGYALAKVKYGEEIVTNGTFETDTAWTKGNGWSIGNGVATANTTSKNEVLASADDWNGVNGKHYLVTARFTMLATPNQNARVRINIGGVGENVIVDSRGNLQEGKTYTISAIASPSSVRHSFNVRVGSSANYAMNYTIDNISVKEITYNQPDGTLQLVEYPDNIPRIEYDAEGNLLGLLIEESRTNLFTYSQDFNHWQTTNSNIALSQTSPSGLTDATIVSATDAGGSSSVSIRVLNQTVPASSQITYSIFLKANQTENIGLVFQGFGSLTGTTSFNLSTLVASTASAHSASIQDFGNGWYRCSITGTSDADTSGNIYVGVATNGYSDNFGNLPSVSLDGTHSFSVYGPQVEVGSFPTSYMKTSGNTAVRSADVASIDVDQFGYNQNEGTLFTEVIPRDYPTGNNWMGLATDADSRITFRFYSGVEADVINSGTTQAQLNATTGWVSGVSNKAAFAFASNDFCLSINDDALVTDTSGSLPLPTTLHLSRPFSSYYSYHIKSITYTPKRLSNAKLQELTS